MQILLHVLGNKTSFIDSQGCSNLCAVEVLLNSLIRLELTLFLLVSFFTRTTQTYFSCICQFYFASCSLHPLSCLWCFLKFYSLFKYRAQLNSNEEIYLQIAMKHILHKYKAIITVICAFF